MNIRKIVEDWLDGNRYDGLYNTDGECACALDDLMPCDRYDSSCEPGYFGPCPPECGEHDFHVVREKPDQQELCTELTAARKALADIEQLKAENFALDELAKNLAAHDTRTGGAGE